MFCTYDLQHNLSGPAELPGKAIPVPIPKVNGKRMARNVHAPTEEECEQKLAELIKEMKKELGSFGSRKSGLRTENLPPEKHFRREVIFLVCGCCMVKNNLTE